ncbi:uncharacterized protein LOC112041674, partial [Lingula anatina]|uniref:Uncharacterized protein LOC112041674 n=1 Tax=Lingula anatina TaxID=7574 RepID=A0A2R2ML74_LINAN
MDLSPINMADRVDKDWFSVRNAKLEDAGDVWRIVQEAGWVPFSLQLIKAYMEIAKDGWWVAEVDGKVVGCVMLYGFNETYTFLGILIVEAEYRGKGIGKTLKKEVDSFAGDRTISLVGGEAGMPVYFKWGFKRSIRGSLVKYRFTTIKIPLSHDGESKYKIKDYSEVDWKAILDYDTSFHVIPRE